MRGKAQQRLMRRRSAALHSCCDGWFSNSNSNCCRPTLINMASYPEGYDLGKEQAVLAVCSTQVWG